MDIISRAVATSPFIYLAAGVPAVKLDAWKTRKYAESQEMLEKTDVIDALERDQKDGRALHRGNKVGRKEDK